MYAQLLANGIALGSQYALLAVSFALIYRTARFYHFAHGAIFTVSAYALFVALRILELPLWAAVVFAVVAGMALGVAVERFVYAPLRRRGTNAIGLLLASFGFALVLQNIVALAFGDATLSVRSSAAEPAEPGTLLPSLGVTGPQVLTAGASVLTTSVLGLWLLGTSSGRAIRAVGSDPDLARILGVQTERVTQHVFLVGSAVAAVAAILAAHDTDLTPLMGFRAILMAIVAAIIGGFSSVLGPFIGGLAVGAIYTIAIWALPGAWAEGAVFIMLAVALLLRPGGFMRATEGQTS